jgi:hypothetical protein
MPESRHPPPMAGSVMDASAWIHATSQAKPARASSVLERLRSVDGVTWPELATGPCDVIAKTRVLALRDVELLRGTRYDTGDAPRTHLSARRRERGCPAHRRRSASCGAAR